MKISIQFDDTNPNDSDGRIQCALRGIDFRIAIDAFANKLRQIYKYRELTPDQATIVEEIRSSFYECMEGLPDAD